MGTTEKGIRHDWIEEGQLWELPDPTMATYRKGTTTSGMLYVTGSYMPEGILPPDLDRARDRDFPYVGTVAISEEPVLADHHALLLDLYTVQQKTMPRCEQYNIQTMTMKQCSTENEE